MQRTTFLAMALAAGVACASPGLPPAAAPAPAQGSLGAPTPGVAARPRHKMPSAPPARLVDINSAPASELMTLPGVGRAQADKIIANRPYLSKAELVTKNVMPAGPFISLKKRVVALQGARRQNLAAASATR
jgi:DNA uptake protein ComE-like DNA-binding protein